jgi:hypothetical protein
MENLVINTKKLITLEAATTGTMFFRVDKVNGIIDNRLYVKLRTFERNPPEYQAINLVTFRDHWIDKDSLILPADSSINLEEGDRCANGNRLAINGFSPPRNYLADIYYGEVFLNLEDKKHYIKVDMRSAFDSTWIHALNIASFRIAMLSESTKVSAFVADLKIS